MAIKHKLGDGIDWSKVRTRRERRYSEKWLKARAERKSRRSGLSAQPRDDLGFIITRNADGTMGRKPDTKLAHANAALGREMNFEIDKAAAERKAKRANKKESK